MAEETKQDLKESLNSVMKTGKMKLGYASVSRGLLSGNLKIVITASNCDPVKKEDLTYYSKLAEIRNVTVKETSRELGAMCGKPFPVSAIGVVEEGDSNILKLKEE